MGLRQRKYFIEAQYTDLPDVVWVIDTANIKKGDKESLGEAGVIRGNKIIAYHMTDDASVAKQIVKKKTSFQSARKRDFSGIEMAAGLYMSGSPGKWKHRSEYAVDYLFMLENFPKKLATLKRMLRTDLKKATRLSSDNVDKAKALINDAGNGVPTGKLERLSRPPFNLPMWGKRYKKNMGYDDWDSDEGLFRFVLEGKFAGVGTYAPSRSSMRQLRKHGFSGAYYSGSQAPQLVLWNGKAVKGVKKI